MGNPQILLFDLDGTLLRNDKSLTEYTLEILSKCKGCGYIKPIQKGRIKAGETAYIRTLQTLSMKL